MMLMPEINRASIESRTMPDEELRDIGCLLCLTAVSVSRCTNLFPLIIKIVYHTWMSLHTGTLAVDTDAHTQALGHAHTRDSHYAHGSLAQCGAVSRSVSHAYALQDRVWDSCVTEGQVRLGGTGQRRERAHTLLDRRTRSD